MKKLVFVVAAFVSASLFASVAKPVVTASSWSQDKGSRKVTVSYTLDAPAIVTMDVLTNGVSIGMRNVQGLRGDVHKLVEDPGVTHTIEWLPYESWASGAKRLADVDIRVTAWATNAPPDYFVANLDDFSGAYYADADALPAGGLTNDIYRTTRIVFKKVHAAFVRWRKGPVANELGRNTWYKNQPAGYVTLTRDYYLAIYLMTQKQLSLATDGWGLLSSPKGDMLPANTFAYDNLRGKNKGAAWPTADLMTGYELDSGSYILRIRSMFGNRYLFDLPTEAQWEFACRAGTDSGLFIGYDSTASWSTDISDYARWYGNNTTDASVGRTKDAPSNVGSYKPNPWGFYDMIGNAREWVLDRYGPDEGPAVIAEDQIDPVGPSTGTTRVMKGGCYSDGWDICRSDARTSTGSSAQWENNGFRLCIPLFR